MISGLKLALFGFIASSSLELKILTSHLNIGDFSDVLHSLFLLTTAESAH